MPTNLTRPVFNPPSDMAELRSQARRWQRRENLSYPPRLLWWWLTRWRGVVNFFAIAGSTGPAILEPLGWAKGPPGAAEMWWSCVLLALSVAATSTLWFQGKEPVRRPAPANEEDAIRAYLMSLVAAEQEAFLGSAAPWRAIRSEVNKQHQATRELHNRLHHRYSSTPRNHALLEVRRAAWVKAQNKVHEMGGLLRKLDGHERDLQQWFSELENHVKLVVEPFGDLKDFALLQQLDRVEGELRERVERTILLSTSDLAASMGRLHLTLSQAYSDARVDAAATGHSSGKLEDDLRALEMTIGKIVATPLPRLAATPPRAI